MGDGQWSAISKSKWTVLILQIDYPVAFGKSGLIGAAALEDIKHWEAFLFIPGKLIIS